MFPTDNITTMEEMNRLILFRNRMARGGRPFKVANKRQTVKVEELDTPRAYDPLPMEYSPTEEYTYKGPTSSDGYAIRETWMAKPSKKPKVDLTNKSVEELEKIFNSNPGLEWGKEDDMWKDIVLQHFATRMRREDDESWFSFYKRAKKAEEDKLGHALVIQARNKRALEEVKKTLPVPPPAKKRRTSNGKGLAVPKTEEMPRVKQEVLDGNKPVPKTKTPSLKRVKQEEVKPEPKPKPQAPTPLMKKAMAMMKKTRR